MACGVRSDALIWMYVRGQLIEFYALKVNFQYLFFLFNGEKSSMKLQGVCQGPPITLQTSLTPFQTLLQAALLQILNAMQSTVDTDAGFFSHLD